MTTFQDPPPQSRRSARQNERGEQQVTGEQPDFSAELDANPASGRRDRPAEPHQPLAPEPLTYATQGRPAPGYESIPGPTGYTPVQPDPAGYRVRDFSPEGSGRRAAAPPLVEPQQPVAAPSEPFAAAPADLEYRTQAGPAAPAAPVAAPATVAPPAAAPSVADPSLTTQAPSRRELRQRQAEADAAAAAAGAQPTGAPFQYTGPTTAAPAATTTAGPVAQPPVAPAVSTTPPPPVGMPSTMTAPPPQRTAAPTALSNAMAEFESLTRPPHSAAPVAAPTPPPLVDPGYTPPPLDQTGGWVAPLGHWSRQADLDDETQPWENTITREVGGGNVATTTSALVLPEIPRPTDFPTALDSTGEVLLTGSIDLPQSLSTGGGDPRRYDDPNVDLMFDTQDAEFTGTDSSPVRAIRAVSTHTSSRGVIHANKPHGNRMIVVVFIATAVLAVSVVGLFIASIVLDVF